MRAGASKHKLNIEFELQNASRFDDGFEIKELADGAIKTNDKGLGAKPLGLTPGAGLAHFGFVNTLLGVTQREEEIVGPARAPGKFEAVVEIRLRDTDDASGVFANKAH